MGKAPSAEQEIKKERDRANEEFTKKLIKEIQAGKDLGELLAEDYKDVKAIQEQDAAQLSGVRVFDPCPFEATVVSNVFVACSRDAHIETLISLMEDIAEYGDNADGNRLIPGDTARAIDQIIANRQDLLIIAHQWRLARRHMLDQALNLLNVLWLGKKICPGSPIGKKVYELLSLAGFMGPDSTKPAEAPQALSYTCSDLDQGVCCENPAKNKPCKYENCKRYISEEPASCSECSEGCSILDSCKRDLEHKEQ